MRVRMRKWGRLVRGQRADGERVRVGRSTCRQGARPFALKPQSGVRTSACCRGRARSRSKRCELDQRVCPLTEGCGDSFCARAQLGSLKKLVSRVAMVKSPSSWSLPVMKAVIPSSLPVIMST